MSKLLPLQNVANDLRSLADSIQAATEALAGIEITEPVTGRDSNSEPPAKGITLEQVRAVLAEKSQDGFTAEVRSLLEKHGAPRLSEINPAKYAALLKDAEDLK